MRAYFITAKPTGAGVLGVRLILLNCSVLFVGGDRVLWASVFVSVPMSEPVLESACRCLRATA